MHTKFWWKNLLENGHWQAQKVDGEEDDIKMNLRKRI